MSDRRKPPKEGRKEHIKRVLAEKKAEEILNKMRGDSEFICDVQFRNTLPDIPCDPKFVRYDFPEGLFTKYETTSLERMHIPVIHIGQDLGIPIDLIDSRNYNPPRSTPGSKKVPSLPCAHLPHNFF